MICNINFHTSLLFFNLKNFWRCPFYCQAARRQQSSAAKSEALKTRGKLLKNLLKHEAVRQVLSSEAATAALGLSSFTLPGPAEEEELYKLPPMATDVISKWVPQLKKPSNKCIFLSWYWCHKFLWIGCTYVMTIMIAVGWALKDFACSYTWLKQEPWETPWMSSFSVISEEENLTAAKAAFI